MSGVLQGTVLAPLLFSLHIIDIMSDIESKTRLFLLMIVFAILKLSIWRLQVSPDITPWSGSTELMRVIGEARIKYLSHRAGRDDVTTGKLFPSRGECLGLYHCVLIIFKHI